MKLLRTVTVLGLVLVGSGALADDQEEPPKSSTEKIVTKVLIQAGRIAAGSAIGGTAGKVVQGGPIGAAVGTVLTPTEIGCGEGETCARR